MAGPGIVFCVLQLLGDGRGRTSEEIANALHEQFGYSRMSVRGYLSFISTHRQIERRKRGRVFEYRRTDVEAA
jgi:hypothetical protein